MRMRNGKDRVLPPDWALRRPKTFLHSVVDFLGSPLRMILLPDSASERWGLTSLRCERFAEILPELKGRVLDIGAGDNMLLELYERAHGPTGSIGVDVVDWGGGCLIVPSPAHLPFADRSFDTVSFVACLNHIPERAAALDEARRLLVPGGRVVLTMIGRTLGAIGHRLWWYSEDKHRDTAQDETGGLDHDEMLQLLSRARFANIRSRRFFYGLNRVYVAERLQTT